MKIKTRNRIFTTLMILTLFIIIINGIFIGIKFFTVGLSVPENKQYLFLQDFFLTKYNLYSVIIGIFLLLIYCFTALLSINVEFEKTQSSEIIYFVFFLLGLTVEFHRLFFPLKDLWFNSTNASILVTKAVLFGRTVCPLALLFSVIYSNFESRQYIEQNIVGLTVASIFVATLIPVNTSVILPTGRLQYGFGNMYEIMTISILITALVSQFFKNLTSHTSLKLSFGFLILIAGYLVMQIAYNIFFNGLGIILLCYGTFMYLKALHQQYLWN